MAADRWARGWSWLWATQILVLALSAALWCERQVGIDYYRVVASSMEPTLHAGEIILVNRWATIFRGANAQARPKWRRGAVVTIRPPRVAPTAIVKRVVAIAGDTIFVRNQRLYVNGEATAGSCGPSLGDTSTVLDQLGDWYRLAQLPSTRFGRLPRRTTNKNWGPLRVPSDSVFVLGDNQDQSRDSRSFGFVAVSEVAGEVVGVIRHQRFQKVCSWSD